MAIELATDAFSTPDPKYLILINERQRHWIQKVLEEFVSQDPGLELDARGNDIPTHLSYLFTNNASWPLSTTEVNDFTEM